jgi:hypothetical protein
MPEPVKISIRVPLPPDEVFDFVEVIANQETLNDHTMTNWQFVGPDRGVGARARAEVSAGGLKDTMEIEIVECARPHRIVASNRLTRLGRIGQASYTLGPLLDGGTHIAFEFNYVDTPMLERLLGPLSHLAMHKTNAEAMRRLEQRLGGAAVPSGPWQSRSGSPSGFRNHPNGSSTTST